MSSGTKGRTVILRGLAGLCWLGGSAAMAATPGLAGVRLGAHEQATRIVLDVTAADPDFHYSLSEDGLTLEVKLPSRASSPSVPKHSAGLVRAVSATTHNGMADIIVSGTMPMRVVATGMLAPSGAYRFHRIYLDIALSTTALPAPAPQPEPTIVVERHEPVVMAAAETSAPEAAHGHAEMHSEGHGEAQYGAEHAEAEPLFTVKIGGTAERSLSDYTTSAGPTFGLETGLFHDALEVELSSTPLMRDSKTTWKSGLIIKKPIELSENVEFELGLGPIWLHRGKLEEGEAAEADSIGGEAVAELVVWPFAHKSLGFYVESGYSYDFGKGHEKAAGGGAGLLINIP